MIDQTNTVLRVNDLKKHFPIEKGFFRRVVGHVKAVDGVSFTISQGETLGLVGESGCGKTTTARTLVRALLPTSGEILLTTPTGVVNMATLHGRELRAMRRHIQMVFQDPYGSLDPRMTVFDIVAEPLSSYGVKRSEWKDRVGGLLEMVGLDPGHMGRYPHAFSGGQRQRLGFARACALDPILLVADEPVSALDVSVQAQVLNVMKDIQDRRNGTSLFITHDLAVVRYICDRVAVMYDGHVVEVATTADLFEQPAHPYTELLLVSVPDADPTQAWLADFPDTEQAERDTVAPTGCPFAPRCRFAQDRCREALPQLREITPGRHARCVRAEEIELHGVPGSAVSGR